MVSSTVNSGRRFRLRQERVHRFPSICVVDARPADYEGLGEVAAERGANLHSFSNAGEALRHSFRQQVDVWVINTCLPDQPGTDLCSMLRQRNPKAAIYLVADEHSPEVERAARQARPTLFGCKGEQEGWLRQWLDRRV